MKVFVVCVPFVNLNAVWSFFFFVSVCARASLMCVTADRRYCTGLCKANCSQMYCAINYRVFLSEATELYIIVIIQLLSP